MAKSAVISSSNINSYGFRVLSEGIDIEQYKKNPVVLYMHERAGEGRLPIGRMEDVHFEGDLLIGTPVFDMNDEFAAQVADKWENGFLKMLSAGLDIVETSTAPEVLLPGQQFATVTASRLREVSVVDIGANDDALQLCCALYGISGNRVELSEKTIGLTLEPVSNNQKSNNKMKQIAEKLGLSPDANEEQVLLAIGELQNRVEGLSTELLAQNTANINNIVGDAIKAGRLQENQRADFVELGTTAGVELLKKAIDAIPAAVRPSDVIKAGGYQKLSDVPKGEIAQIYENQRDTYNRLYKAEYGVEPNAE